MHTEPFTCTFQVKLLWEDHEPVNRDTVGIMVKISKLKIIQIINTLYLPSLNTIINRHIKLLLLLLKLNVLYHVWTVDVTSSGKKPTGKNKVWSKLSVRMAMLLMLEKMWNEWNHIVHVFVHYLGGVYEAENAAVLGLSFWRNDDIGIVSCGSSLWNHPHTTIFSIIFNLFCYSQLLWIIYHNKKWQLLQLKLFVILSAPDSRTCGNW